MKFDCLAIALWCILLTGNAFSQSNSGEIPFREIPFDDRIAGSFTAAPEAITWYRTGSSIQKTPLSVADDRLPTDSRRPNGEPAGVRSPVTPPDTSIGKVYFKDASGNPWQCTGTLVTGDLVVTAGHCVHPGNGGNFYSSIEFLPGYADGSFLGRFTAEEVTVFAGWYYSGDFAHDVAFIRVTQVPRSVHRVGLGLYKPTCRVGDNFLFTRHGYTPLLNNGERQWESGEAVSGCYQGLVYGSKRTHPGSSGSPSMARISGYVFGVHSAEDDEFPFGSYDALLTKAKLCFALRFYAPSCPI
ncbi:trypsin-like serine peptidase [Mesorhizobium retamae]|uniref:Trypsin-like serine protease n=1 Tax=Mesorhizobium retamae TaxID=2912854 RepID=A0ABS9QP28_9HYPH|nr:trypsin-like peptidase domain-containing protein [Mesorhizobium sp. IRAMC:0171]MCG7509202.1 trypsin-like serine protease [Mesorhizobium sp. IRAMC:0171]